MKNFILLFIIGLLSVSSATAQKYFTKTGHIAFYSDAKLEKIEAHNKSVNCVVDAATNKMEFGVLIKGFQFEKALMQEHFNENYLESSKFPKATFKGDISGFDNNKSSPQTVTVTGDLTMHGVTKKVTTTGTMTVKNGKVELSSTFTVALEDYKITIPAVVKDQVAKTVKIVVTSTLEPLK
jgi:polyisoprenoid-binding protein YceI